MGRDELSASRKRIHVQVTGMTCSSCVSKIERHLKKQPGEVLCGILVAVYILSAMDWKSIDRIDLSDYSKGGRQITYQPKVQKHG